MMKCKQWDYSKKIDVGGITVQNQADLELFLKTKMETLKFNL